ncbi:MAG TPA: hypothetical protein VNJ47_11135, partial [Nevskiales bacterium]|nr:hypothetical protein [Nevskiales bacterium]
SALGYSGTAGNAPWVHNSEFYKNQTGMATESVFGGHPGMPQDHALWENNKIYSNNKDYYKLVTADGPCVTKKPSERGVVPAEFRYFDELPADFQEAIMDRTVVCPPIPFPTGTGMIIAGGNYDVVSQNQVFDNWRQGLWLLAIPTLIHKLTDNPQSPLDQAGISGPLEQNDPTGQFSTVNDVLGAVTKPENSDVLLNPVFTAHFNRVIGNRFGENSLGPVALSQPNGVDIWWDNSGTGNCFVDNTSRQGEVTSDLGPLGVMGLPTECADGDPSIIQQLITARPNRLVDYVECLNYSRTNPDSKGNCPFFSALNAPAGREPGVSRITSENPAQAVAAAAAHGRGNLAGYFVLHNDSNSTHRLQGVTLSASGPVAALGGLRLVVRDIRGNTFTAQGQLDGSTLSFSFDTPVSVPVQEATLVELERIQSLAALPADGSGSVLLMATLGLGGAGSLLLTLFGSARRSARVSLALTVVLALGLSACGGDSSSGSSGGGSGTQRVSFTLTQLQFEGQPADADYAGLPLAVGSVTLQ